MNRLPGTGIPTQSSDVAPSSLVVCGESPKQIFDIVNEKLHDWTPTDLSWGFREFYFRNYRHNEKSLNILVGGLGSASVELILQEGTLAGSRNFILSGSCASLRSTYPVGTLITPSSVILRSGAMSEYITESGNFDTRTALQKSLNAFLEQNGIASGTCRCISTDAFYGIGGSYDSAGNPIYAGATLKGNTLPHSLGIALKNTENADCLDMELAPFFVLGGLIKEIQVAALKSVSNHIPWGFSDFNEASIKLALTTAVDAALDFTITCS